MKTDLKMYVFPLLDLDENKKYQVLDTAKFNQEIRIYSVFLKFVH